MPDYTKLRKELAIILVIKALLLITIKMVWFSDSIENPESAITRQFLSQPQNIKSDLQE